MLRTRAENLRPIDAIVNRLFTAAGCDEPMNVDDIYRSHPLSRATILARIHRRHGEDVALSEWDLAIDPETEITDQNHSGGVQAVLELASAAGVRPSSRVVDVGAGLGGSARVLAAAIGCHVSAVERDAARCDDCRALTAEVGLAHLVAATQHDALSGDLGLEDVDVLWGQSAWVHFPSPASFLETWLPALSTNCRIAMADSYLARVPAAPSERVLLDELDESWGAHLVPVSEWNDQFARRGFTIVHQADHTAESMLHFKKLAVVSATWPQGMRTEFEARGWERALKAFELGLIQTVRTVAAR